METKRLPVKLTPDELIIKGRELAEMETTLSSLKEEKKESAKGFSQKVDAAQNTVGELAHIINTKAEFREVEVETVRDEKEMTETVVRKDTGEIVSERLLTPGERQQIMQFPKPVESDEQQGA